MDSLVVDITNILGAAATVVPPSGVLQPLEMLPLESDIFWLVATLVVIIGYGVNILQLKSAYKQLYEIIFRKNVTEINQEEFSLSLTASINFCYFVALPLLASYGVATVVAGAELAIVRHILSIVAGAATYYACLGYRHLICGVISYLTDRRVEINGAILCSKLLSVTTALTMTPLLLIYTLYPSGRLIVTILAAIIATFEVIRYLIATYYYFNAKNVSFLQYILYLCSVEIAPIGFFAIIFSRNITPLL